MQKQTSSSTPRGEVSQSDGGECEAANTKDGSKNRNVMTDAISYKEELLIRRKELRRNLTPEEAVLWTQLKAKGLDGSKWRKQHSVGNYILDFYCPEAKLCVELDGERHYTFEGAREDDVRTSFLNKNGIRVVRFENRLIWENLQGVIDTIKQELKNVKIENKEY